MYLIAPISFGEVGLRSDVKPNAVPRLQTASLWLEKLGILEVQNTKRDDKSDLSKLGS